LGAEQFNVNFAGRGSESSPKDETYGMLCARQNERKSAGSVTTSGGRLLPVLHGADGRSDSNSGASTSSFNTAIPPVACENHHAYGSSLIFPEGILGTSCIDDIHSDSISNQQHVVAEAHAAAFPSSSPSSTPATLASYSSCCQEREETANYGDNQKKFS
jgi:hypothetical protein